MSLVRLLVLAEERLLGLGVASLLSARYETHTTESFHGPAADMLGTGADIALWIGDRINADAVEQLAALERQHPQLRFCVLARAAEPEALQSLLDHELGALAVLVRGRDLDVTHVLSSVDELLAGRSALDPRILARMIARDHDGLDALASLTKAEQEVLELVALGLRNREIARRMRKSEKAVEKRVSAVFQKLGLDAEAGHELDRRVSAARIFFTCRPQTVARQGSMNVC